MDEVLVGAFERDGCALLKGAMPQAWVARMRAAADRVLASPGPTGNEFVDASKGRFFSEYFVWLYEPDFRAFALESPLPEIAAGLMRSGRVNLFGDQLLSKEPGTAAPTEWHVDKPYLPITGDQALAFWVPLDPGTPETGVLSYLKGSHAWPGDRLDAAVEALDALYAKGPPSSESLAAQGYDVTRWSVEPGDVLVHHAATAHFAAGNASAAARRRVVSVRYTGDDAVYAPKAWSLIEYPTVKKVMPAEDLRPGAPMGGAAYPRAWPRD